MSAGDWKAFFQAAQDGDKRLVHYYLESGIDPNYQHPEVMTTALCVSIAHGHDDIASLLLQYGSDPLIKNVIDDLNAREAAVQYNRVTILRILDEKR